MWRLRHQTKETRQLIGVNFKELSFLKVSMKLKQFVVRGLDWPETANTWEPSENLPEASDVIDAFEERLKSVKQRKRKGKEVVRGS
ncbi:hypothetical protein L6164_000223 [Bauhinia variegata]|uniref:Uncharacterized protein n=1 Tax=Bauhinia variegata TaxID=167791 RepID=A0ACB9Q5Z0_BAUVA|nr:hypothetical protein L6164_000223 [Bauhinia variegata]